MDKKIIVLIALTLMLGGTGLASAFQVTISPFSVNLGSVYPGEIIAKNFTVSSDSNYTVYFATDNSNITIDPSVMQINNGDNITLNFTVGNGISSGSLSFNVLVSAEDGTSPPKIVQNPTGILYQTYSANNLSGLYNTNITNVPTNSNNSNKSSDKNGTVDTTSIKSGFPTLLVIGIVLGVIGVVIIINTVRNKGKTKSEPEPDGNSRLDNLR